MTDTLAPIALGLTSRSPNAARHIQRELITAVERETKELPPELVRNDGSLDIYDDVLKLLQPVFKGKTPAVQCGGWLGYIPLNDRYALDVDTRVPVANIERLIGKAGHYEPKVLEPYSRLFSHTTETPASLFDLLTDQLLAAFERISNEGLVKAYERREQVSSSPRGKIDPFASRWWTLKAGRPVAVSSAFYRTPDSGPNRVLKLAFERLLLRNLLLPPSDNSRGRIKRLQKALDRLSDVSLPSLSERTPTAILDHIKRLPFHHAHYADALRIAQLIVFDLGIAMRGQQGETVLPTILIDMAFIFESYSRRLLVEFLKDSPYDIKDGNLGGDNGAKRKLFEDIRHGLKNPPVTPDIVLQEGDNIRLVIDAKYKSSPNIPEREEINQVVTYGARYGCEKIMLLYAGRENGRSHVEQVGKIGSYQLYVGQIDLGVKEIEAEEMAFCEAVRKLL